MQGMKGITGLTVIAAFALAACSQPEKKPVIPPDPDPKNGVVGLVSETKVRDISDRDSFMGALSSIFSGNTDQAVASNYWEVTVFYDDGTTGTVIVDKRPALQPGQKVRVTGNKIELRR
jgi:hypothetical protein